MHQRVVEQPAVGVEHLLHAADVDVPEDGDEPDRTHDPQQALDDAGAAERFRRHADDADGRWMSAARSRGGY